MDDEVKNGAERSQANAELQGSPHSEEVLAETDTQVAPWGPLWSLGWGFSIFCVWGIAQLAIMGVMKLFVEVPVGPDGEPTQTFAELLMGDGDLMGIVASGSALVGSLMILAVVRVRGIPLSQGLALKMPKIWVWPIVFLGTPVLLVVLSLAVAPFAQGDSVADQGKIASAVRETQWLPLLLLGVAVGAPFFEEFLFRGILHEGLKQSFLGKWGSGLVTAAAFSAVHSQYQDPSAFVLLFLLGCAFTIGRELSGSIYVPILMHAIQNSLATIPLWLALNGHIPEDQIPPDMREVIEYSNEASKPLLPPAEVIEAEEASREIRGSLSQ